MQYVIAYSLEERLFEEIPLPDGWASKDIPATHAVVKNHADALNWLNDLQLTIVRSKSGYAAKGPAVELHIPPELFISCALANRATQVKAIGFYSLNDALTLSKPDIADRVRAWAIAYNEAMHALHEQVSAGTMSTTRALAELPKYE